VVRYGRITKRGDAMLRSLLHGAALTHLAISRRPTRIRDWGLEIAARRGRHKAIIAVARRLAVVMHRMWLTGEAFRPAG
jgi:transposase